MTEFPRTTIRLRRHAAGLTIPEAANLTHGAVSARTWGEVERAGRKPSWAVGVAMLRAIGLGVAITVETDE